jgi:hypothetical protein
VTGIEARDRACAQLQPDELWHHSFSYGDNKFLMATIKRPMANIHLPMANIRSLMAEITSRYGENYLAPWQHYSGMAKTLWRAISNGGS